MEEKIVFEGVTIKKRHDGWRCPFKCHDTRFPAPKWKTEKGFMKHLEQDCWMTPSAVEDRNIILEQEAKKKAERIAREEKEMAERLSVLETLKDEFLKTLPYKIGDEIAFIDMEVAKDTHEQRGRRMVKVRYEQVLRFEAVKTTIKSINFKEPTETPTIENMKQLVYFNNGIRLSEIIPYEDALRIAREKTKGDEEYRQQASSYR